MQCYWTISKTRLSLSLLLALSLVLPPLVCADALVIIRAMTASTIAEVFVREDGVRVELEIGMQDIPPFSNILPDDIYEKLGNKPLPLQERLRKFVRQDMVILADGEPLDGALVAIGPRDRVRRDEISGEPLPVQEAERETVVFAVLRYPFKGRPGSITITPPVNRAGHAAPNIGFVTYHLGIAVNDFRYLSAAETLDLDWEDPWYSQFRKRALWRRYKEPMSVFIYVEPFEVRKEVIVRPTDLEQWLELGIEGKDVISAGEQEEIRKKAAAFFSERGRVFIDGKEAAGTLDRVHFIRRSLRMTSVIDPPEDLPVHAAMLGIIFVYPLTGLPQEVTMTWDLFNERIQKVNAATTDEAGGLPYPLEPDDPVLRWKNFLTSPTIPSLVDLKPPSQVARRPTLFWRIRRPFARSRVVADSDAKHIIVGLLKNIYHAFDFRDESHTYDVLARSASGDLLTRIYLETRRALELKNQGGAKVKVKEVELVKADVRPLESEVGFVSRCTWTAGGSVGHWGHIHMRRNQYEAVLTVKAIDGEWKITGLEILSEERL